jgi:Domain of unknown function (DUF4383)
VRSRLRHAARHPGRGAAPQLLALALGAWLSAEGLAAAGALWLADGSPAVALNVAHALFHLLAGIAGLAAARREAAARAYLPLVGVVYLVGALSGVVSGDTALGLIAVDPLGNTVHGAEGALALAAAAWVGLR